MVAVEVLENKFFHLHNDKISYLFYVMENGQLGHLYYGAFLGELTEDDFRYMLLRESKSAGTVKYSDDLTLSDRAQEYPVYGSSDFREGAIEVMDGEDYLYLDFKFDSYTIEDQKPYDLKMPLSASAGNVKVLKVRLKDSDHKLTLTQTYAVFDDVSAVVRSSELTNDGDHGVQISKIMSGALELPDAGYELWHLCGAWLKEDHVKRQNLAPGHLSFGSLRGATSHQHNPFAALVEKGAGLDNGVVYASNLIYSGNFITSINVNEWNQTRLYTGINPDHFSWLLEPDESFKTPEAVLFHTKDGINGLMKETHAFVLNHIISPKWQNKVRPIVLNNWEATYFDFDERKLLELAEKAKDIGIECFAVDDGWFGHRNDDRTSLGNWTVDERKFPNGISAFAGKIHEMGLKFGMWFEPEMVSPDTRLYEEHPEWVVGHPYERRSVGRGQYVLDFANPQVVDAIYQQMKAIIEETGLDYIKWDMNRNITEAYSNYLHERQRPQGEFFHRYILGVYSLYAKILSDFPEIFIEGCASGGGRYDLGIMCYSPMIWPSDDSDAVERLDIMSGAMLAYPLAVFSNHVSACPNDQIRRNTPLEMRHDVCDFGALGYELDITKLSDGELAAIKANIAEYKKQRELILFGQFRRLLPFDENEVSWCVTDGSQSLVGFYRKLAQPNTSIFDYLKLPFADEDKRYLVDSKHQVKGSWLKNNGLLLPYQFNGANADTAGLIGDFQSARISLEELN